MNDQVVLKFNAGIKTQYVDKIREFFDVGNGRISSDLSLKQNIVCEYSVFKENYMLVTQVDQLCLRMIRYTGLTDIMTECLPLRTDLDLNRNDVHDAGRFTYKRIESPFDHDVIVVKPRGIDRVIMQMNIVTKEGNGQPRKQSILTLAYFIGNIGDCLAVCRALFPIFDAQKREWDNVFHWWKGVDLPTSLPFGDEHIDLSVLYTAPSDEWVHTMLQRHGFYESHFVNKHPYAYRILAKQINWPHVSKEVRDFNKEPTECMKCMNAMANTRVRPCDHKVLCEDCADEIAEDAHFKDKCIVCGGKVEEVWLEES